MILADKIILMRKKNGWSQEELADKMDVSRQAVSKWESAATVPSLEKILQLSALFGVTSDYLLKDEIEDNTTVMEESLSDIKRVSLDEAERYVAQKKRSAYLIAIATFLCIISPITLIIMEAAAQMPEAILSETLALSVGLIALFFFILCAVPVYVYCGFKNAPYEFLEKSIPFELDYGVQKIIKEKKEGFKRFYTVSNITAVCICVFSPLPLLLSAFSENDLLIALMLATTMLIAGTGVFIFIVAGVQNASIKKLLKEGEYTLSEKKKRKTCEPIVIIYWIILIAVYLTWSFLTNAWYISWLVFAIGGILFPALMAIIRLILDRHSKDK